MLRRLLTISGGTVVLCFLAVGLCGAQSASAAAAPPDGVVQVPMPRGRAAPPNYTPAPTPTVTLTFAKVRLDQALDAISAAVKVTITYTDRIVPVDRIVSDTLVKVPVREAVERVLRGTGVVVREGPDGQLTLVKPQRSATTSGGQDTTAVVVGQVTAAETGVPLVGATITIAGTSLSAVTRDSGYFAISKVPMGGRTITARLIGYHPVARKVVVDSAFVRADFALEAQPARLEELVSTATGSRRRLELGNAITTIQADSVAQVAPIKNMTDLLETRVPGLTVQRTSGAPGDPARLRLRGVSSVFRGNDPIIILDGVRVYSDQTSLRSGNLADLARNVSNNAAGVDVAAPSPLDQIDPNSVETVEVLKGPSAATLYGADAANGVIVITTKRGRPGPPHWTASVTHGRSTMAGEYPEGYFRWGHSFSSSDPVLCPISDLTCVQDSLVRFQALNDPDLTVFGRGSGTSTSLGVSGGSSTLQYAVTGSVSTETGLLQLPGIEVDRFDSLHGTAPPDWMLRPHHLSQWSVTSSVSAQLGRSGTVTLLSTLTKQEQRRTSLENQVGALSTTYVDKLNGRYYPAGSATSLPPSSPDFIAEYYRRITASTVNLTNGISATWQPRPWFSGAADAGVNIISRNDESLVPPEMRLDADSLGELSRGTGRSLVGTVNLRGTVQAPLPWGFKFQTSVGANYTSTSTNDLLNSARGLVKGTNSLNGAQSLRGSESQIGSATFGWFIEPSIAHKRFFLSSGLRFDGGSTYGTRVTLAGFPKLSASWVISQEPFFPLKGLFSSFQLRAAYGQAGVQPGATDRLRLFTQGQQWLDGTFGNAISLSQLGNTQLRPERSTEFEGGFYAELLDNRLSVDFTTYRKTRVDALMPVPLPPSVYGGGSILLNVGTIRNSGLELTLGLTPVRLRAITWSTQFNVSRNRNLVVELGPGVTPFLADGADDSRVAAGYPLFGRWARPIIGYADANGDGVIERNEVQLGDSLVYMGSPLPNYQASAHTNLALLNGALSVGASFAYEDGLTQVNQTARNRLFSRGLNDSSAPLGEQATAAVMFDTDYGLMQTVSLLRWQSLSIGYRVPSSVARLLGADEIGVAVQGSNLGLHTNYRGKDPSVGASPAGNAVLDAGQLPQPRSWQLRVDVRY